MAVSQVLGDLGVPGLLPNHPYSRPLPSWSSAELEAFSAEFNKAPSLWQYPASLCRIPSCGFKIVSGLFIISTITFQLSASHVPTQQSFNSIEAFHRIDWSSIAADIVSLPPATLHEHTTEQLSLPFSIFSWSQLSLPLPQLLSHLFTHFCIKILEKVVSSHCLQFLLPSFSLPPTPFKICPRSPLKPHPRC